MKNPTAKTYEGPKNYRKLVQNVPKLYSLSDKQLEVTNPFEKNLITTHTQISKSLPSHKGPANDSSPTTNDNVAICSYLNKPMTSRGKLESRQINEVAGRSLNIWRSSKKRLSNALCASATVPSGATPSLKEKNTANNFGDYWDTKRSSKAFHLSWNTRQARLWNGSESFNSSNSIPAVSISSGADPMNNTANSEIYLSYYSKNHAKLAKKDNKNFQLTASSKLFLSPNSYGFSN